MLALAGCASPAALLEPAADGHQEDILDLETGGFAAPSFGAYSNIRVRATFEVLEGGPIDVWLGDQAMCASYGQRTFVAAAEALNVRNGTLEARFPAGPDCLLIENGPFAKGQANATGPVRVRYSIDVWEE